MSRLALESALRQSLERRELFLVYQPQVEIATGEIVGAGALLRWQHPERKLIPPDTFIHIAETSGLIVPIGEWVLKNACAQVRQWQNAGLTVVPVAVNVSAVQFRQKGFIDFVRAILQQTDLAPELLELELTETQIAANPAQMLVALQQLREIGVTLSIDDFGTGYSNLIHLRRFPVSRLKIDRSFVRDIATDPDDAAITGTIIKMAKSLGLKVIAEGVETGEQISFLSLHECEEIQGYYISEPMGPIEFADCLRSGLSSARALRNDFSMRTAGLRVSGKGAGGDGNLEHAEDRQLQKDLDSLGELRRKALADSAGVSIRKQRYPQLLQ